MRPGIGIYSYEKSKHNMKSKYHFDTKKTDPKFDTVIKLGKIIGDWSNDLSNIIADPTVELPITQEISNLFGLSDCQAIVQVQLPGDVHTLRIDELQKWDPAHPYAVRRILVHLSDWEMGHFCGYGNYIHSGWSAGDVTTFDWQNVPYCTANAGTKPKVTLQLIGVETEKTTEFVNRLVRYGKHVLTESNGWF